MNLERRHIRLEGGSNMRDIGGYRCSDGRTVRWGRVYRSGALWRLSAEDWAWIAERDIAALCDLRSREERELAPTTWGGSGAVRRVDEAYGATLLFSRRQDRDAGIGEMETHFYLLFARLLAPSLRLFFGALLEEHLPAIVHCTAGQDRTGLAIGLLLSALGVERSAIFADYALSTELRVVDNEMDRAKLAPLADSNPVARFYNETLRIRGIDAFTPRALVNAEGQPLLSVAFAAIEGEWGSLEAYLASELGVDAAGIERLKALLLELAEEASPAT